MVKQEEDDEIATIRPRMSDQDRQYFLRSVQRELARKQMLIQTLENEMRELRAILTRIREEEN